MSLYNERRHPQGGRGGVEMTGAGGTKVKHHGSPLAATTYPAVLLKDSIARLDALAGLEADALIHNERPVPTESRIRIVDRCTLDLRRYERETL